MTRLILFICVSVIVIETTPSPVSDAMLGSRKMVAKELSEVRTQVLDACKCSTYSCGCCAHLEERELHLNSTICTNITYLEHDYGISFTVTVDDYTLYNATVSARNPPPVCIGVPYVKEFADVCIRLYDINATTTFLHACVRAEAWMKVMLVAKYDFGCINIGPPASSNRAKLVETGETPSPTESNASIVVIVIGIMTGLIVVTFIIFGVVALAKRGNANSNQPFRRDYEPLIT